MGNVQRKPTTISPQNPKDVPSTTSTSRLQQFQYTPTNFGSPLKDASNLAVQSTSSDTALKKDGNGDIVKQQTSATVKTPATVKTTAHVTTSNDSSLRKRKLPNWMMDNEKRSKEMQARMKKNSLFK